MSQLVSREYTIKWTEGPGLGHPLLACVTYLLAGMRVCAKLTSTAGLCFVPVCFVLFLIHLASKQLIWHNCAFHISGLTKFFRENKVTENSLNFMRLDREGNIRRNHVIITSPRHQH